MKFTIGDMLVQVNPTENIFWILVKKDAQGFHFEAGKRKIRYVSSYQLRELISSGIYQYFPVVK
jgi:hypothetical protein